MRAAAFISLLLRRGRPAAEWTYIGSTASTVVSGATDVTTTEPAGSAEGDLQIVQISYRGNVPFATPSGWTLALQDSGGNRSFNGVGHQLSSAAIFYRVRGSSAGTLAFSKGAGTPDSLDAAMGVMTVYRTQSGIPSLLSAGFGRDAAYAGATVSVASQDTIIGDLVVGVMAGSDDVNQGAAAMASGNIAQSGSVSNTAGAVSSGWRLNYYATTTLGSDGSIGVAHARSIAASTGATTMTFASGNGHSAVVAVFRAT